MPAVKKKAIADADEVLSFITSVLRGEQEESKLGDRLKAADMLGKRYRLFMEETSQELAPVTIVDDVNKRSVGRGQPDG